MRSMVLASSDLTTRLNVFLRNVPDLLGSGILLHPLVLSRFDYPASNEVNIHPVCRHRKRKMQKKCPPPEKGAGYLVVEAA